MNEVTTQTADDGPKFKVALGRSLGLEQWYGMEVRRERADLSYLLRRADQEILVLPVQPAKSTNYISGVGANAEIRHAPDINPDLHVVI